MEVEVLAYALHRHGTSVAAEDTRMLKELAYECPNERNTTVASGFRSCSILTQMHFACIRAEIDFRHIADEE